MLAIFSLDMRPLYNLSKFLWDGDFVLKLHLNKLKTAENFTKIQFKCLFLLDY